MSRIKISAQQRLEKDLSKYLEKDTDSAESRKKVPTLQCLEKTPVQQIFRKKIPKDTKFAVSRTKNKISSV